MAEAYTVVPLSRVRKMIAARMAEAKRTIPHFRLTVHIELDALLGLRGQLREQRVESYPSINDLLIKASAGALMDVPAINSQWAESEIHQFRTADIAVVTALEGGGLTTPIVRAAESKTIWEIAREVKALSARAAANTLRLDEVLGGSFSISNLGMYDVDQFDAIINPPQCAILAVGSAKPHMVVARNRQTRIATLLPLTLSVDHRAIDGATAAVFLSALRNRLEQPDCLLTAPTDAIQNEQKD